jgi:hypothetical protein
VGENCGELVEEAAKSRVVAANFVVVINVGYAPAQIGALRRDTHASELLAGIVDLPAVDVLLDWGRIIGEGIQLVEGAKAASQGLDGVVDATGLGLVGEMEGDNSKVSAANADGMVLSKDGRHRSVDTRRDHRVCDPHLFDAALAFGRSFRVG